MVYPYLAMTEDWFERGNFTEPPVDSDSPSDHRGVLGAGDPQRMTAGAESSIKKVRWPEIWCRAFGFGSIGRGIKGTGG